MPSSCDPRYAPAGDVSAALLVIDSRLKAVYDGQVMDADEQRRLDGQFIRSLGPTGAQDLLDGACTLIFMFMKWLRSACEQHDQDVIEYVVPNLVTTMGMMPRSIRPETVPIMAGLVVAAGTGLSPSLWRRQYGEWTPEEMNSLEATAFLLAELINRATGDRAFATRMIADALTAADGEEAGEPE
ncbi:hypothetical protein ACIQCR_21560 [Streptomyces sp. NPDC093249]|uniref:hypothetical protein n=1 Tax=unclassified Streptomyces TaxID=2593676 RepID=UPI003828C252